MKATTRELEIVTRNGKPVSVIIPIKDYKELLEAVTCYKHFAAPRLFPTDSEAGGTRSWPEGMQRFTSSPDDVNLATMKATSRERIDGDRAGDMRSSEVVRAEVLRLAQQQKSALATTFQELLGNGGPPDETADEMISAIRQWRDTPSPRSLE